MRWQCLSRSSLAALAAVAALALLGAAPPKAPPMLDVAQAGPDYAVQGEYLGAIDGGGVLAAQVAAMGGGAFAVTFLPGGLPGAGWDNATKAEAKAKTEGDQTTASGAGWSAQIAGETMTGKTAKGESFTLKKTVRRSPTLGAKPPAGAVVLFDGTNTDAWAKGKLEQRGFLCVLPDQPITKQSFGDFTLHLEVMLPFQPQDRGQGRGNSGVYLQDRYEVQVVDSFGFKVGPGRPNGDVIGDIYSKRGADTNAALPPLTWQTYDIDFTAARWADDKKTANATATVRINGILIHNQAEISGCTGGNGHKETPEPGPLMLQNHSYPVVYRNIWIVPKG